MLNALTIDVEEWYQVTSLESYILRNKWFQPEQRITGVIDKILDLLSEFNVQATFFILGCVAEEHPEVVQKIIKGGHEIASHSYSHKLVCYLSPEEFKGELRKSKAVIEKITGKGLMGFRAPSWSITPSCYSWVFEILKEQGLSYDSSVLPGNFRFGGFNNLNFPYSIEGINNFMEFPPSTLKLLGRCIPFSGGFYLRAIPLSFIKNAIQNINKKGKPAMIYLHTWELDMEHPRLKVPLLNRVIHYYNLETVEKKLRALLSTFQFTTVINVLNLHNS